MHYILVTNTKILISENVEIVKVRTIDDINWLTLMLAEAKKQSSSDSFGIFGTSVAATWIAGELGNEVDFFVDEDPGSKGKTHLSRPILTPDQVPQNSTVFLAFIPQVAKNILQRLNKLPIKFYYV